MLDKKKDLLLFSFVITLVGILLFVPRGDELSVFQGEDASLYREKKDSTNVGHFKGVNYYSLDNRHQDSFHIKADVLESNAQSNRVIFVNPRGEIYSKDAPVFYQGEEGVFDGSKSQLLLKGKVSLARGEVSVECGEFFYDIKGEEMAFNKSVKSSRLSKKKGDFILIKSERATTRPALELINYFGNVRGEIRSRLSYASRLFVYSDQLELNMQRQYIKIEGNVKLKREQFSARGRWGEIFLEGSAKRLRYFALYDDIELKEKVVQEGAKDYYRRAYAEKLEGPLEGNNVVLTGRPRVFQHRDVIKGRRITLKRNEEMVEVDDASANFFLR